MTFADLIFLADENVHPAVVSSLRRQGRTVRDVKEEGLQGTPDLNLLLSAFEREEAILTHDSDFGMLAIAGQKPFFGIVYVRPGHFDPDQTIATLNLVARVNPAVTPPFVLVAERKPDRVRIRLRSFGAPPLGAS